MIAAGEELCSPRLLHMDALRNWVEMFNDKAWFVNSVL